MVTPKEARKYLGRIAEVKGLALGFVLGISVSIVAEILLLPLETRVVDNSVQFWYLGESRISISRDLYISGFVILFLILLSLLYYGYKRIYEIPSAAEQSYWHGTRYRKPLTEVLGEEFEKLCKPYGYEVYSIQTPEKDFKISFEIGGRERLWVFVKDSILQLRCEIEKTTLDLADEVEMAIGKTIKNTIDLMSVYRELLRRDVDEVGLKDYVLILNRGETIDQVRQSIRQSKEYREKQDISSL